MAKPGDSGHYVYYSKGDSNKTFILVKLTDSALNAIENHLSSNSQALPSISFKSETNNGVLSLPVPNSNHAHSDENSGGPGERRFSFNLSNVEAGGPQGSFECLRQSESRILESLGSIQYKMQIHASEDSYERTKERMAESQNESKKYCTKVIKGIGSNVGRRSKVKNKFTGFSQSIVNGSRDIGTRDSGGGGNNLHHSSALSSHNHKSSSPTVKGNSSGVSKYNLYHGSSTSTTISSSSSSGTGLTSTTTSTSSSLSTTSSSISSSSNGLANSLSTSSSSTTTSSNNLALPALTNSSQPSSSTNGSSISMNRDAVKGSNLNSSTPNNCNINANNSRNANSGSKVTMASNPELMKRSLRERVIHLLALRPYKKPELLAKLNKEGIKEKDKKNLSQVFNTISKLKENAYNLAAHAWHEVQVDDWPFYTPEQREQVRRNRLNVQQRSSTGKYGLSPLTCLQDSSPPASSVATSSSSTINNNNNSSLTTTSKRSAETGSSSKRQRINANNQSSSKRGLSPNVALNHNTNSMMNNSSNNNNHINYNKTDLQDIMSEWSMKPRSPEPNYYNSASNNNNNNSNSNNNYVDNTVTNGENNSGSMSKIWINENGGSDETRSSHNTSDYYVNSRSTVNSLSEFDQFDTNSHGNGHSSHAAHRLTNGYSNSISSEGNQSTNGHPYSNRYSSTNNHHYGSSNGGTKSDYNNGDINTGSGSGNSNSENGINSRKRLKNGYNNNNSNSNNISHNNNHNNSNNNNINNNSGHHSHSSGVSNLMNSGSMINSGSACSTPNSSPDSGTGSNDGNLSTISSKSLSSINGEMPDYAIKYIEITSDEQARRYKEDFNREYKEYRRLHRSIDEIALKFAAFETRLKSLPEGSDEWNRTLEEVFREYDSIKKDYKFMESKRRAAYLHEKLSHIKKLIQEYKLTQGHHRSTLHPTPISHHHNQHQQQSNHH